MHVLTYTVRIEPAEEGGYDVFVPTQPYISMLVAGKILQPLNLSYIPNLRREVWRSLQSPWYDVGSRYTVPYTIFSTGIAWRNDKLVDVILAGRSASPAER